jgi:hypothetical protein
MKLRRRERNATSQPQSLQWNAGDNGERSTDILHLGGLRTTKGQTNPITSFYAAPEELATGRRRKSKIVVSVREMLIWEQPLRLRSEQALARAAADL